MRSIGDILPKLPDGGSKLASQHPPIDIIAMAKRERYEIPDHDGDPQWEEFYLLCALEIGDPTQQTDQWKKFHALRVSFFSLPPRPMHALESKEDAAQVLAYILWYQRQRDLIRDKSV